jgi:hypothetical protein
LIDTDNGADWIIRWRIVPRSDLKKKKLALKILKKKKACVEKKKACVEKKKTCVEKTKACVVAERRIHAQEFLSLCPRGDAHVSPCAQGSS